MPHAVDAPSLASRCGNLQAWPHPLFRGSRNEQIPLLRNSGDKKAESNQSTQLPRRLTRLCQPVFLVHDTTEVNLGFPINCFQHFHTSPRLWQAGAPQEAGRDFQGPSVRLAEDTNNICENPNAN